MKYAVRTVVVVLLLIISISSQPKFCGAVSIKSNEQNLKQVYVVNYPLYYFAKRISGNRISVIFPVPQDDVDPAYWNPDIKIINKYQSSDLILLNGAAYAKWTSWASLPISKSVNTAAYFRMKWLKIKEIITHSHGKDGEHSHIGFASTTWLNPEFAIYQAVAIKKAFIELLPEYTAEFISNFNSLKKDLLDLEKAIEQITAGKQSLPLLTSHPVYQYLEYRYNLNIQSVHWEPDEIPNKNEWKKLKETVKAHPAKWMIWEKKPNRKTEEELLKLNIKSIVFNPCGNKPKHNDFMQTMWKNIKGLEEIFLN